MKSFTAQISIESRENLEFINISDRVQDLFAKSGIKDGLLCACTQHTTGSVVINENCDRLKRDIVRALERLVPKGKYEHDHQTIDGRSNGHSHVMSMLTTQSVTVPITNGELELGTWQSIFFVELDGPRPKRVVKIKVIGE